MQDENLFSHFERSMDDRAGCEALTTAEGREWTYGEVNQRSAQYAGFLKRAGVHPGDRVTVQIQKSPENLCLYLACLRGGYVFHPLNMAYTKSELEYFIENAEPTVLVCDSGIEAALTAVAASKGVKYVLTLDPDGSGTFADGAKNESEHFRTIPRAAEDLAALLYSSGTTGKPKGVMLTHRNLVSNSRALVQAWDFSANDRLLHALPIFHVHGLFVAIGCVLLSGASMRWLSSFDAREVVKHLPECSVMMGVPTFYTRLLAEPSFVASTCRNIRVFISGSAPLLEETFAAFESRTGHRILERYGMTETNMNTSNPLYGERRAGTVGPPLPGVEVRVVDDRSRTLPPKHAGNLQVRGPNVFHGYWRLPDQTAKDFTEDGFFDTGDIASIDDDGYVSIVGRAKDVIITGGFNVYPKELELFIDGLPTVRESAVIGVPHPDFGEAVVAVVVLMPGENLDEKMIISDCKGQVAGFKVPKRVLFVDELPRNTMSKVQKNLLRQEYRDLFSETGLSILGKRGSQSSSG